MMPAGRAHLSLVVALCFVFGYWQTSAWATTWGEVRVTCPICGTETTADVVMSTSIFGYTTDLRPTGVGVDMDTSNLVMCKGCGFTVVACRYSEPEGLDVERVRAALDALPVSRMFAELDRAIAVERAWTGDLGLIAHYSLGAKWRADATGEPAVIRARLQAAIEAYRAALHAEEVAAGNEPVYVYLIGELYRERGDQQNAVSWLETAVRLNKGWLRTMAAEQLFLAKHADAPTAEVLRLAQASSDEDRLAALPLLRDSTDADVVAFLRACCSTGPSGRRQLVIETLSRGQPNPRHLPIYLEGLRSVDAQVAHTCLYAVEQLKAAEAAGAIVEALRHGSTVREYPLHRVLAAVATEQELDYLGSKASSGDHHIFSALLNTRSVRAIPRIVEMLGVNPTLGTHCSETDLENAAALGGALLDALPDLSSADGDDARAVFKVRVLQHAEGDRAGEQLRVALCRGGEVAFHAALGLARGGEMAAKPVLMEHLKYSCYWSIPASEVLAPVLRPGDYEELRKRMAAHKAEQIAEVNKRLAECRAVLNDPEADAEEKAAARRRMDGLEWDEESFMKTWLPVLGASGSEAGRPLYLRSLAYDNARTRTAAVRALARVCDDEIAMRFTGLLKEENSFGVVNAVIEALGSNVRRDSVPALLSLVDEPTPVSTKLVWIDAMMKLAPERARPVIRNWADSPDAELRAACERALGLQTKSAVRDR
jgi:hypothetical protein